MDMALPLECNDEKLEPRFTSSGDWSPLSFPLLYDSVLEANGLKFCTLGEANEDGVVGEGVPFGFCLSFSTFGGCCSVF